MLLPLLPDYLKLKKCSSSIYCLLMFTFPYTDVTPNKCTKQHQDEHNMITVDTSLMFLRISHHLLTIYPGIQLLLISTMLGNKLLRAAESAF